MGKQGPGKWIRNLLLGKKSSSSKSNPSKQKDIFKPPSNKDVVVAVSSEACMSVSPNVTPPTSEANATKGVESENELVTSGSSSNERAFLLSIGDELEANANGLIDIGSDEDHLEKTRLVEAATVAQATFRGYQARRTFRTLKAIIPLQALIRGQLVRREAVSALYCVNRIVKFQALVRGYNVRHSDVGLQLQKICKDTSKCSSTIGVVSSTKTEKLSDNAFVHKLVASSPSEVSLHLKYDYREANLAWEWLDRWTRSQFWSPLDLPENDICQTAETETPARVDDVTSTILDSNGHSQGRHPKTKEQSQKDDQKSNSKKKSTQNAAASDHNRPEVANEKRKHITRKISDHITEDEHDHNVNYKNLRRRASLPGNFIINHNNEFQKTPSPRVPSYMAPTESAKAKLRLQGSSSRHASDLVNRRLSLSTSLSGKLGLFSPTSERFGAISSSSSNVLLIETDRSLSSSRDWTDKLIQPRWRR